MKHRLAKHRKAAIDAMFSQPIEHRIDALDIKNLVDRVQISFLVNCGINDQI